MRPFGQERLHPNAKPDGARGEIDVVLVLGARGIGLRSAEGAEALEIVESLIAEEILDGVKHRTGVGFDGDAVLGPQHVEIQRRHQGDERSGGGLMAADLQAVAAVDLVIGMMDHVGGEPQHLALQLP